MVSVALNCYHKNDLGCGKGKDIMKKQYIKRFLAAAMAGIIFLTSVTTGNAMEADDRETVIPKEVGIEVEVTDVPLMGNADVTPSGTVTPANTVTATTPIPGTKIEDLVLDPNFVEYLKTAYDPDGNGYMTDNEVNSVRIIDVTSKSIHSLEGIENFKNLETLFCAENQIASMDLSSNTKLTRLECQGNNISSLDLSKNTNLTTLDCSKNVMVQLDIIECYKLKELNCNGNYLNELQVQFMKELTTLNCSYNPDLTTLDVQNNRKLKVLTCNQCSLDALNVKNNEALEELYCAENKIVSLEVQNNKQLKKLECNDNNMSVLNLSGCERLQYVKCNNNQISELNLQKSTPLNTLNCKDNKLTQLDVRNNKQLTVLNVNNNNLLYLDVSQNSALTELYCESNKRIVDSPIVDLGQNNLFDLEKVSQLTNATMDEKGLLRFVDVAYTASYKYEVREGETVEFGIETRGSFKEMTSVNVETIKEQVYTGSAITPQLRVLDGVTQMKESVDYEVQYLNHLNAGTATVKLKGLGIYDGTITKSFKIVPMNIADIEIEEIHSQVYTGSAVTPKLNLSYGENDLKYGTDYTANYSDNFKIGQAKVEIIGKGNYTGSTVRYFNIEPKHIGKVVMKPISNMVYTGQPMTPDVILEDGTTVLQNNIDYTFTYEDNVNAGIAKINIKGMGNYGKEAVETFVIEPRPITNFQVDDISDTLYSGEAHTPAVSVYDTELDYALVKDQDYQVSYENNVNAGTAKVFILGIGNYKGTIEKSFVINVKNKDYVSVDVIASQEYTAREIKPEIKVFDGEKRLVHGTDYSLAFSANTELGSGKVEVILQGNYSGIINTSFKIVPRNLENVEIEGVKDVYYNGKETSQTIRLSHDNTVLTEGTDYQVSYRDNVEVGKAKVIITGKGNYTGTQTLEYSVLQCPIKKVKATYEKEFLYDGEKKEPEVVLSLGEYNLEEDRDYILEYLDNVNAGKGKIVVKGRGDFSGEYTWEYSILPRKIENFQIEEIPTQVYTGNQVMPDVFVTDAPLTVYAGRDYKVIYENNVNQGKACAKVIGIGNYTGERVLEFEIEPREIRWVDVADIPAKVYNGKEIIPEVVLTSYGHTLEEGKDYKIAYKDNLNVGIATIFIEGLGNYTSYRTVEFEIKKKNVEDLEVSYQETFEYTEEAIEPEVTVAFKDTTVVTADTPKDLQEVSTSEDFPVILKKNQDYIVRYYNNKDAGTGEIQIEGVGNFGGVKCLKFTITPKSLKNSKVTMSTRYKYTGKARNPYLLIILDGKILFSGKDYTKTLKSNKKVGQATLQITGKNNYAGTIKKRFVIYPRTASIKKLSTKNKTVTINWTKRSECTGYVVEYAQDKGFVVDKKRKVIKSNKTTRVTVKKLIPGVRYYYRVRSYTVVNGKKIYGNYSVVRSIKVKQ